MGPLQFESNKRLIFISEFPEQMDSEWCGSDCRLRQPTEFCFVHNNNNNNRYYFYKATFEMHTAGHMTQLRNFSDKLMGKYENY